MKNRKLVLLKDVDDNEFQIAPSSIIKIVQLENHSIVETKDSIVITIKSKQPFKDWLSLKQSFVYANMFIMNSSDLRPCDYDLYPFNHIQNLLNDLDSTMNQDEAIQAILLQEQ